MKDASPTPGKAGTSAAASATGTPGETSSPGGPGETAGAGSRHPFRPVVAVIVLTVFGLTATAGFKSYRDLDAAMGYERQLLEEIAEAKERVRLLDRRIDRIRNDPAMLERLAREDLGLARAGDVVIVLPDPRLTARAKSSTRPAGPPASSPATPSEAPPTDPLSP